MSFKNSIPRICSIDELLQTDGHRIIRTAQPDYNAVGKEIKYLIEVEI